MAGFLSDAFAEEKPTENPPQTAEQTEFFEANVRPLLISRCYECHSGEAETAGQLKGELRLDTRAAMQRGGSSGQVLIPGKPDESLLIQSVRYTDLNLQMPPEQQLSQDEVAILERWVSMGAPDPRDTDPHGDSETSKKNGVDFEAARKLWAFQIPVKHDPPEVMDTDWPQRQLDHFILSSLEQKTLSHSPQADRRDLIRRASFDLTGLPPTPDEVEAFENDPSPQAWETVVTRLLNSPHYGERWGRYWLDVARYADDQGNSFLTPTPAAYLYRDWVVKALNDDMPYDEFLRLQIAGDEIPGQADDYVTRLAGLGFQSLGPQFRKGAAGEAKALADELEDRVDTLSRGILGLTVSCARCHDHKFDPIPTRDYYALAAAYNGAEWPARMLAAPEVVGKHREWTSQVEQKTAALKKWKEEHSQDEAKLTDTEKKERAALEAELSQLTGNPPPSGPTMPSIHGGGKAMKVFVRGNPEAPGEDAPPGFLRILSPEASPVFGTPFTRLNLADAVISPKNPLTARVLVNRVWHYHFGRGIVPTLSNFGKLGGRPSHPELLDTLAVQFMEAGWSIKWLHREILLSSTWQQSSKPSDSHMVADPGNELLWRMTPRRLDFEAWRDALLSAAGRLDPQIGGPSVDQANPGVKEVEGFNFFNRLNGMEADNPVGSRRTLYTVVSRYAPNTTMILFDFPEPNVTSDQRNATTIPQQQLFVLNSAFMMEMSRAFSLRLESSSANDSDRIQLAWRLAYGRPPEAEEMTAAEEFLVSAVADKAPSDQDPAVNFGLTPWQQLAHSLLASNEFLFIP
ncbi:MAG: PSD1 and planctomycete cytochrome C domain-containing protein [Planctomyces sp.]